MPSMDPAKRTNETLIDPLPSKRRKLDHVDGGKEWAAFNAANASTSRQSHPYIKRELSPTPPPSLALRTSGTVRVGIPSDCRKSQFGWKERRDRWVVEEASKLKALGLKVTKRLIREDGLALDWVSLVPVCPLTLKPPTANLEPTDQIEVEQTLGHLSPQRLGASSTTDPLGHALRDQSASARSPVSLTLQPPEHFRNPKASTRPLTQPIPGDISGGASDFIVVGAALLKDHGVTDPKPSSDLISNGMTQREHRRLLPSELRTSSLNRFAPNTTAKGKDWRERRKAWVKKEIEKVEGYTGESVCGYQFDRDDVIIRIRKRRPDLASQDANHNKRDPLRRTPIARRAHQTSDHILSTQIPELPPAPSPPCHPCDGSTKGAGPPINSSFNPAQVASTSLRTQHVATDVHPLPSALKAAYTTFPTAHREANLVFSFDHGADLNDPQRHKFGATQARGLGFLEQYLQLFDSDREALSLAYTPNATFSLTQGWYGDDRTGDRLRQIVKTGPSAIVEALKTIGPHLHHSPLADISYNIATLDDMSVGGLLLTCEGALVPAGESRQQQEHQWTYSRTLVLRQNPGDSGQVWPLQIAAERLAIQRTAK